ncbi:uncharacterized protein IL334_005306 [Kwoniella shivajii]|uniref:sn-1-specific diacylglycerol lipase n=1 Tax=Kwoniella shivajii TaxID=564305 RepID=A0ABZ1D4K4_9TREE|nr:hypothetical protein IL334_005306 [Kwoniella shivajii]
MSGNMMIPYQHDSPSTISSTTQPDNSPHPRGEGVTEEMPGPMIRFTPSSDINNIPTIFPAPVASLITTIATSTRMSLRITAFLIEAILETGQYTSRMTLGYTRRLLITAISSARRVYLMSNAAIEGDLLSLMMLGTGNLKNGIEDKSTTSETAKSANSIDNNNNTTTDHFLNVLDKYTNLGIYIIHHAFTMVELFTMSGFFFTSNLVNSAHTAAIESVALFDSLFGSNESSRALSAIITMVRKEVIQDERCKDKGTIAILSGLTKALTAFACLQVATWKRTNKRLKMKVLYDCTIQAEQEDSYTTSTDSAVEEPEPLSLAALEDISPIAGPGPSTLQSRRHSLSSTLTRNPLLDEANKRLWEHVEASETTTRPNLSRRESSHTSAWSMEDLDDLVGESGDEIYEGPPDDQSREQHRQRRRREATLEITDELTESTVITQMLERVHSDGRRFRVNPRLSHRRQMSMPDIAIQDLDDEDIPIRTVATSCVNSPRLQSNLSLFPNDDDEEEAEEDWVEVDTLLSEEDRAHLPSLPNGDSIGTSSYIDALEHPHHNAERIQLVIKTMTNKLLQRKRTVRHVLRDNLEIGESTRKASTERPRSGRGSVRDMNWNITPQPSLPRSVSISSESGSSTRTPTTPLSMRTRRHNRHMSADKAVSKVKNVLSPSRKSSSPAPTHTPSREGSPSPISRKAKPEPIDTSKPKEGVRAPPPSPHQSIILRNPSQPSPKLRMTSTRQNPQIPLEEQSLSRPSLSMRRESVHTSSSRVETASSHLMPERGEANPDNLFPHEGLIRNIHRFMRYSSAAYGQNFLRIFGLGSSDFMFPSTGKHHANSWAFAQHTNIPIDCLLLSSFTESSAALIQQEAPPLVHYVAVEHSLKAIVLTCRGTLGLSDVLVDLTCEYQSINVDRGDPDGNYYVHAGMWQSARKLTVKQSTVHEILVEALTKYPTYGLVLAGHSLGGGVAALLSILCSMPASSFIKLNKSLETPISHPEVSTPFVTNFESGLPPGRPIHCYAYGPPAVTSPDLCYYTKGLITSVVQDSDVVPTLSLGGVKDFKNIALTLSEEGNIAEEIVGRVIGINKRKFDFQKDRQMNPDQSEKSPFHKEDDEALKDEEILSDWMVSLIKTMRADMDNEKLYPPGMVYIMEHFDVFVTDGTGTVVKGKDDRNVIHKQAHRVILRQCDSVEERFREPIFAKSMLQNHLPSQYERSTHLLYEGLGQGKL